MDISMRCLRRGGSERLTLQMRVLLTLGVQDEDPELCSEGMLLKAISEPRGARVWR